MTSELRKQQCTVTLFDCNHLAHVIVLWQMQTLMCYCTVFALFYFKFEGNFQVQAPGDLYLEGRFNGGFLTFGVRGGLYLEELIHGGAYFRIFTAIINCFLGFIFTYLFQSPSLLYLLPPRVKHPRP